MVIGVVQCFGIINACVVITHKTRTMKRTILLAAMLACFAIGKTSAQTVNGIKLADLKEDYIEVSSFRPSFNGKIFITLEYGQKIYNNKDAGIVMDDEGKRMEFNSVIEFVNRMKKLGYDLFQAYAAPSSEGRENNVAKFYVLKLKN